MSSCWPTCCDPSIFEVSARPSAGHPPRAHLRLSSRLRAPPRPAEASNEEIAAALLPFSQLRAGHASTINVLANALHRVFTRPPTDDGSRARLRAACIDYLSLGGACTAGPVGLLSGLTPKPGVLVLHFFSVALHATRRAVFPFPTPASLRAGYDLIRIACVIIMPLLVAERVPFMSSAPVCAVTNAVFPWKAVDPATL